MTRPKPECSPGKLNSGWRVTCADQYEQSGTAKALQTEKRRKRSPELLRLRTKPDLPQAASRLRCLGVAGPIVAA